VISVLAGLIVLRSTVLLLFLPLACLLLLVTNQLWPLLTLASVCAVFLVFYEWVRSWLGVRKSFEGDLSSSFAAALLIVIFLLISPHVLDFYLSAIVHQDATVPVTDIVAFIGILLTGLALIGSCLFACEMGLNAWCVMVFGPTSVLRKRVIRFISLITLMVLVLLLTGVGGLLPALMGGV
jgi:hypothetical protein